MTHELDEIYVSPNSWRKSAYRLCRKIFEKMDRTRMSYDRFKIKNNNYFKENENGKWNRKISTLTSTNFILVNNDDDKIQKMILKLERKRLDTSSNVSPTLPLSRIIENFNRRKTEVRSNEWDIPIIHLVKKYNWRISKKN